MLHGQALEAVDYDDKYLDMEISKDLSWNTTWTEFLEMQTEHYISWSGTSRIIRAVTGQLSSPAGHILYYTIFIIQKLKIKVSF